MGHRHLLAYKTLEDSGIANVDLVALCDIRPESTALCAGEMERVFGRTPMVFNHLDEVLGHPDIAAVDVVTDGSTHHEIAVPALEAGQTRIGGKTARHNDAGLSSDDRCRRSKWGGSGHG